MIRAVLESIQIAKELIMKSQYDTGEDDEEGEDGNNSLRNLDIPSSVQTDLQLLEVVIQSATGRF
jgi:hypothetical protein